MKRWVPSYGLMIAGALSFLLAASTALAAAPQSIAISEVEFKLIPDTVTVAAGQPVQVTVTNNGKIQHNLTFALPSKNIEDKLFSTNLNPGETRTVEFTFSDAGDWQMFCPIPGHADAGMKGVIHVTAAAAAPSPTAPAEATMAPAAGATSNTGTPSTLPTTGAPLVGPFAAIAGALGLLLIAAGLLVRAKGQHN